MTFILTIILCICGVIPAWAMLLFWLVMLIEALAR